jgi:hypothetical protein
MPSFAAALVYLPLKSVTENSPRLWRILLIGEDNGHNANLFS